MKALYETTLTALRAFIQSYNKSLILEPVGSKIHPLPTNYRSRINHHYSDSWPNQWRHTNIRTIISLWSHLPYIFTPPKISTGRYRPHTPRNADVFISLNIDSSPSHPHMQWLRGAVINGYKFSLMTIPPEWANLQLHWPDVSFVGLCAAFRG